RGDLRGVQRHRQLRDRARPQGRGQAHLPRARHHEVRHPQGGAPGRQGRALEDVGAAPRADADGPGRRPRVPDRQAEAIQDQRRLLRGDEHVGRCVEGRPTAEDMIVSWAHAIPSLTAAFLASLVEFVEALTVVLAVGTVRGWRPALFGTGLALATLALLVLALGPALTRIPIDDVQLAVGIL